VFYGFSIRQQRSRHLPSQEEFDLYPVTAG
jgi:hypothetical protein